MNRQMIKQTSTEIVEAKNLFNEIVEKFISSLDTKKKTKDTYRRALRVFEIWVKDKGIINPKREHILEYKDYLRDKTVVGHNGEVKSLSPLSITAYLSALRCFFTYLEAEHIYPNIAKGIKGMKKQRGFRKDALTAEEVKRLLESIKTEALNDLRDYALINLIARTGLRTIEVSRAEVGDIGREGGETVLRVWGKGRDSKDEFVILTDEAYKPILDYLQAREAVKDSEPLFLSHSNRNKTEHLTTKSISRIVSERLKSVGLKNSRVTAHSLRHTAGTIALMNGARIEQVKDMLRHSDINTTMIYAHNINRLSDGAEKYVSF